MDWPGRRDSNPRSSAPVVGGELSYPISQIRQRQTCARRAHTNGPFLIKTVVYNNRGWDDLDDGFYLETL